MNKGRLGTRLQCGSFCWVFLWLGDRHGRNEDMTCMTIVDESLFFIIISEFNFTDKKGPTILFNNVFISIPTDIFMPILDLMSTDLVI